MNKLYLVRKIFTNNSTIGLLTFDEFTCWVLEPSARRIGFNPICIPSGSYALEWRYSDAHHMWLPGLLNVPGRTDIEIHPGNFEGALNPSTNVVQTDSLGCLIPGKDHGVDYVSQSVATCKRLFPLIEAALKQGGATISIAG